MKRAHQTAVQLTTRSLLPFLIALFLCIGENFAQKYYGKSIGKLSQVQHAVKGDVYAVDSRTIHIKDFSYDGTAPDAFFYAGHSGSPNEKGVIIPDENGRKEPLRAYRNRDVTLTLPDGMTIRDIAWISIWCRLFSVNFGHVKVPANMDYPRPQKIDPLPTFDHDVRSDQIVVVDAQTLLIPNFYYDGTAPDAFFWVGKGSKPGPNGKLVPDENGSSQPLKKYSGKTIVITLPAELTVYDIDYLSIWCREFFADFSHVKIPKNLNIPPSLKMLGIAPQTKLNCEVLYDDLAFEVRWAVAGESIVMQLVGTVDDGEYMAFGLSGSNLRSTMIGGDVLVAWLDQSSGKGEATDYNLNAKSQCQGGKGSCPDSKNGRNLNNVRLLNAAFINDFTMITLQRPLAASDTSDKAILPNKEQAVIWAIGPINSQGDASYHRLRLQGDMFIDFGRPPTWNCPFTEEGENVKVAGNAREKPQTHATTTRKPQSIKGEGKSWSIPPIPCYEPEDGVFYAQIGPSGGNNGYNAITGHVGWGIAWYINGLLIPEIYVVRGKSYTFVVEGGLDATVSSKYHPFYITDDPEGGYEYKTNAERDRVQVFAGVEREQPTAYGRLCEWIENPGNSENAYRSFGAFQRTLNLECEEGQPGILQWTPDENTPDLLYYQCYTHRFLGWKIHVLDQCNNRTSTRRPNKSTGQSRGDLIQNKTLTSGDDVTIGRSTRYQTKFHTKWTPNLISLPQSSPPSITTNATTSTINVTGFKTLDRINYYQPTKLFPKEDFSSAHQQLENELSHSNDLLVDSASDNFPVDSHNGKPYLSSDTNDGVLSGGRKTLTKHRNLSGYQKDDYISYQEPLPYSAATTRNERERKAKGSQGKPSLFLDGDRERPTRRAVKGRRTLLPNGITKQESKSKSWKKGDPKYSLSESDIIGYTHAGTLDLGQTSKDTKYVGTLDLGQMFKDTKHAGTLDLGQTPKDTKFARNGGFDPSSVVFEDDFRPMTKEAAMSSPSNHYTTRLPLDAFTKHNPLTPARNEHLRVYSNYWENRPISQENKKWPISLSWRLRPPPIQDKL